MINALLKLGRPGGQLAELAVRRGEPLLERLVVEVVDLCPDVPSWIEAPALRFDLLRDLATVEADDIGNELQLLVDEVAVRTVELAEDLPGIDEQDLVCARGIALAVVEEPQRDRQRDGVEESSGRR